MAIERERATNRVRRSATGVGAVLAVASTLLFGTVASAPAVTISAAPVCCAFVGSPFSQGAGEKSTLSNPGSPNTVPHNVYADQNGPDGGPLFFSRTVTAGASARVKGAEYLVAGTYPFQCTLHPGMAGVLNVGAGTPLPRPKATPSIRSRSLAAVRRKGQVEFSLRSAMATGPVQIFVLAKGEQIAFGRIGSLSAGESRKGLARLTGRGGNVVRKGRSVKVTVEAIAEFGTPARTSRVLRVGR